MPLEGQRVDRYQILRLLGGGGMGDVYLAEDPHIGQQVAIKIIRSEPGAYPDATSPREATELFYREIKSIGKLDHPHILPLFDYGQQRRGTITLTTTALGTWAFQFSPAQKQMLTTLIAGKTQQQAQALLQAQTGVQQATIKISGGRNTLPADPHQISTVVQVAS